MTTRPMRAKEVVVNEAGLGNSDPNIPHGAIAEAIDAVISQGEVGLQIAVYHRGELVIEAYAGDAEIGKRPVEPETIFYVWSAGKISTAAALHVQVERGLLNYDQTICSIWPEFGSCGKAGLTVRDALTHRVGLAGVPEDATPERFGDWEWMVDRLARSAPSVEPTERNTYHARTWGYIVGEIVRRSEGRRRRFEDFVRDEVHTPLGITEVWHRLPASVHDRVAVHKGDILSGEDLTFTVTAGDEVNSPVYWDRTDPSGAWMTARAGARLWALYAQGGKLDGVRLLSAEHVRTFLEPRPGGFPAGSLVGKLGIIGQGALMLGGEVASYDTVFGFGRQVLWHPGAGGAIGFADLDAQLSVMICHNELFDFRQMTQHPFAPIVGAIYSAVSPGQRRGTSLGRLATERRPVRAITKSTNGKGNEMSVVEHNERIESCITGDAQLHLRLGTGRVASPAADEVVIRVEAAPINPSDLGSMMGPADIATMRADETGEGTQVTLSVPPEAMRLLGDRIGQPVPAGIEGAGVVVAAGSSTDAQALLGKVVAVSTGAMYARYRVASAGEVLVTHDGTTPRDAASSFVNPMTALGMVETMRREGHRALVHTAAASSLGQMLNRICLADGIPLVNVVRSEAQVGLLKESGAPWVLNSTSATFLDELNAAISETGATLCFDLIGGGKLASQILTVMEAVEVAKLNGYERYGSTVHKQLYVSGHLDPSPTEVTHTFGAAWGIGGWLLPIFLSQIEPEAVERLKQRVADELTTTFASHYTRTVSLREALDPELLAACHRRATGEKYLIAPHL